MSDIIEIFKDILINMVTKIYLKVPSYSSSFSVCPGMNLDIVKHGIVIVKKQIE